jgi:pyruvate/2-oxoglutarate dehydrogenase complex dihydrolipoamide dehydrogenase (E3) component
VTLAKVDGRFQPVAGTEFTVGADTVCLAVGLSPMTELAWMAGCEFTFLPAFGGHVPIHGDDMQTTLEGVYAAGDITGVEEASTAMEEGNLAGVSAAAALGYLSETEAEERTARIRNRLDGLRSGPFGIGRKKLKDAQVLAMREFKREGEDSL